MFGINQEPIKPDIRHQFHRVWICEGNPTANRRVPAFQESLERIRHKKRSSIISLARLAASLLHETLAAEREKRKVG
jgi:hypothetical protein